ncbi:MAG: YihY/virulence factor BrkB family protein [Xanthomonadales bacterium]|nr:YihY/virulence factor BrkB family protein [Xanthomonadales bacterium]
MPTTSPLDQATRRFGAVIAAAARRFLDIDGTQWAAAFAHFTFFALFPLIVLSVSVASAFVDRGAAGGEIIAYVETFIPIDGANRSYIFDTVSGVIAARGEASLFALIMLAWAALGFFSTLIRATNRAWGVDAHNWWQQPLASLAFLAIMVVAVLISIAVPISARMARSWLAPTRDFADWVYALAHSLVPMLVVFIALSLFYRLAPRRQTRLAEVWFAAVCATLLLQVSDRLFVVYLQHVVFLNAVYGTFGGIIALLLWIYVAGCIFVFGACLCAEQARLRQATALTDAPIDSD